MRRHLGVLAGLSLIVGSLTVTSAPASAKEPECLKMDEASGFCLIWAEAGDDSDDSGDDSDGGGGNGGGNGGGDGGSSSPIIELPGIDQTCLYIGLKRPQPPKSDPVWQGHTDGAIHTCSIAWAGGGGQGGLGDGPTTYHDFWAAAPPAAPPPPDPADLAQRALASMGLRAIGIGIAPEAAPGSVGIVGMPTWMWVADPGAATLGPNTATASERGYTVTATATVDRIVWTMGDGSTVTCTGAGTPYLDRYGKQDSPDCGHTYTRQGQYDVTATSYWTVEWSGIGETGVISIDFADTASITIGEAQVITQ